MKSRQLAFFTVEEQKSLQQKKKKTCYLQVYKSYDICCLKKYIGRRGHDFWDSYTVRAESTALNKPVKNMGHTFKVWLLLEETIMFIMNR